MSDDPLKPPGTASAQPVCGVEPASDMTTATYFGEDAAGMMIGSYKLLQLMGKGGMGVVWMAEQTEPVQRRVAVKIIKADPQGNQVLARFEAERQALAMMDHPNIARVFDAGATDAGRPYFVMELVKGIPFNTYCDQEHLTPKERLELFIPVCHAVQHAHQKGIIHRDIKPSNVLIALYDGKPVPKVIDFGIAKATHQKLTERTVFTEVGQIVGTVEYMAPEQAELNNLDIDTRADIYSLGVMLYEVLTGATPFTSKELRSAGVLEMLRMIREVEPARPSTKLSNSGELPAIAAKRKLDPTKLSRLLRGDLDWIVMKCLEKDRARRYETANQLGDELQRYLADEPVQAGPPSITYRARKFLRRNRGPAIAAALVVLALICAIVGTSLGLYTAEEARLAEAQQRKIAQENESKATQVSQELQRTNLDLLALADKERRASGLAQHARAAEEEKGRQLKDSLIKTKEALAAEASARAAEKKRSEELKEALAESQRNLSNNHVMLAANILNGNGPVDIARHNLDLVPPGFRKWEWGYLQRKAEGSLFTLHGHTHTVTSLACSRDGSRIVSGSDDRTVRIWEARTGRPLLVIEGHTAGIYSVAISGDGSRIVSGANDGTVRLFDANSGQALFELKGSEATKGKARIRMAAVAISNDGSRIVSAAANDKAVRVWDGKNGQVLFEIKVAVGFLPSVAISGDGGRIVSGASVFDGKSGELLFQLKGRPVPDPAKPKMMLTGTGSVVGVTDDGRRIVTAEQHAVRIWDADTGQPLAEHTGIFGLCLALSADGSRFVSGFGGGDDNTLRVRDTGTGQFLLELKGHVGHAGGVRALAFSCDGSQIVSAAQDNTLRVWDARGAQAPPEFKAHVREVVSVGVTDDGSRVVSGTVDGAVRLWDATRGQLLLDLKGHFPRPAGVPAPPQEYLAFGVAISGDGTRIVSGCASQRLGGLENTLRVWHGGTGAPLLTLREAKTDFASVAFSSDARRIIVGSSDFMVRLRDAGTGQSLLELRHKTGGGFFGLTKPRAFISADASRIVGVTGGFNKTASVWDGTGQFLFQLIGHADIVTSVAVSGDGSCIYTGAEDKTIIIWDGATGQLLFRLKGHTDKVTDLAISGDGSRLVSGSLDKTVRVWDARSGQSLIELKHASPVRSVAISKDGSRIVSGLASGSVRVWDGKYQAPLEYMGNARVLTSVARADGSRIFAGSTSTGKSVLLWHADGGQPPLELKGHTDLITTLAFSGDGSRLVSGSLDKTVRVWDALTGQPLHELKGHGKTVISLAFSRDGGRIVSGSQDFTPRLWDARSGQFLFELKGHTNRVTGVALIGDGSRIVTGSIDGTIRVWDAGSGQTLLDFKHPLGASSTGVALSPDGSRIASCGLATAPVGVWDARTGQLLHSLEGPATELASVAFSDDGRLIECADANKINRFIWDAKTGNRLVSDPQLRHTTPDGKYLVLPLVKVPEPFESTIGRVEKVHVLILPAQLDDFELGRRLWLTRPDPQWHSQKRREFLKEKNAYAAALHQSWEQNALGVVALDNYQFDRAWFHCIAAAALRPPPASPAMLPKKD